MNTKYSVKKVLKFANQHEKHEYYEVGDEITFVYYDFNDGDIEIKGSIVGIEDEYLIVDKHSTLTIDCYYIANIVAMFK